MRRVLAMLLILGALCYGGLVTAVFVCENIDRGTERADAIIVLGARVMPDGELSTTLLHRVESALSAYQQGRAEAIIVCGAQGADEPETEAAAMARWLNGQGVPQQAIFEEDQSTDTLQNLRNAHAIMRENGWDTALVATSDYHLTRALWLCRDEGIRAAGLAAPGPDLWYNRAKARGREALSWAHYALRRVMNGL